MSLTGLFRKRKSSDMERASDQSDLELSPKRAPVIFPKDTPEWGRILFSKLEDRINTLEGNLSQALDFATQTAKQAIQVIVPAQGNEITDLKSQLNKTNSNFQQLHDKVNNLENQSRRDNLLFHGIKEMKGETDADCKRKIYNILVRKMQLLPNQVNNMRVVRCHRKGRFIPGKNRPIIIKMHWFCDREEIFSRRELLNGCEIYVNEDFSDFTESKRKQLYPIVKAASKLPHYKKKVKIQVDRLVVKGKQYTVDQLDTLPEDLRQRSNATVETKDLVKFFSKASPFSNFHGCQIKVDNITYHTVEQFYQAKKAEQFNDDATAARIMAAKTPYDCYTLGWKVAKFEESEWRKKCDAIMLKGLEAKFGKEDMKKVLLDTGKKLIVECNGKDDYWSCGYYPDNPYSNDPGTWKGQNKLGILLMDLREKLCASNTT